MYKVPITESYLYDNFFLCDLCLLNWSWGRNQNGQLGLGTTEDSLVPQNIEAFQVSTVKIYEWDSAQLLPSFHSQLVYAGITYGHLCILLFLPSEFWSVLRALFRSKYHRRINITRIAFLIPLTPCWIIRWLKVIVQTLNTTHLFWKLLFASFFSPTVKVIFLTVYS